MGNLDIWNIIKEIESHEFFIDMERDVKFIESLIKRIKEYKMVDYKRINEGIKQHLTDLADSKCNSVNPRFILNKIEEIEKEQGD